eukprot:SAG31_NODE_19304_length_606_cov_1.625247_1_plen_146_part_01
MRARPVDRTGYSDRRRTGTHRKFICGDLGETDSKRKTWHKQVCESAIYALLMSEAAAYPAWLPVERLAAALAAAAGSIAQQPPTLQVVRADGTVDPVATAADQAEAVADWLSDIELLEHAAYHLGPQGLASLSGAGGAIVASLAAV